MTRKSQHFPKDKPFREIDWTMREQTRDAQQRALCEQWLKEELYSKYRYNVETCSDGRRVYLRRPTWLNKGFDFQVNLEGFRSVTREPKGPTIEMPSQKDIVHDLQIKVKAHPRLSAEIFEAVTDIYDCKESSDVLGRHPRLLALEGGLSFEKLLLVLKWLFIEQDFTYWLGTRRNMLMSAIEEEAFGINAPLIA